jgi:hypothetical protein
MGMLGLAIGATLLPASTEACMYHWLRGLPEPNGIWPASPGDPSGASPPTDAASAVQQMQQQDALDDAAVNNAVISKGTLAGSTLAGNTLTGGTLTGGTLTGGSLTGGSLTGGSIAGGSISGGSLSGGNLADGNGSTTTPFLSPRVTPANNPPGAPTDPAITAWLVNVTNTYAYSTNAAIEADVTGILANVGTDAYSSSEVYIYATGLPSYNIGPFGNDPNAPTNQKRTFEISLNPTPATTHTATGLGPIGMAVNGVAIFNPWDGNYYNVSNGHVGTSPVAGYWQQNANIFEASTFDVGPGHPAPGGTYHYHEEPTSLINQVDPGNTGQHASPVIGYAADGYPIFGPYGYVVNAQGQVVDGANGQPEVELMTSSYQENVYPGGVRPDGGPTTSVEPDGSYLQDFTYNAGSGTLDQYNGRFAVAPGYPNGTYGYYVTATYPYIIGPDFYGVPDPKDLANGGTITVPNGVTYYIPSVPEPSTGALLAAAAGTMLLRRRRPSISRPQAG